MGSVPNLLPGAFSKRLDAAQRNIGDKDTADIGIGKIEKTTLLAS